MPSANKKHLIELTDEQRKLLRKVLRQKSQPARVLRRCQMLLEAEKGKTDREISEVVGCSTQCVANLRKRYNDGGFDATLYDAPRSGKPRTFSEEQMMAMVHMSAETPPAGHQRWTLNLLCEEASRRKIVEKISISSMYNFLKEYDQPPKHLMEAKRSG